VNVNLGFFTARFEQARTNEARRRVLASVLAAIIGVRAGARGELADALDLSPARVTAILKGNAAFGVHQVAQLEREHAKLLLGFVAALHDLRVVDDLKSEAVEHDARALVRSMLDAAADIVDADADAAPTQEAATRLRGHVRALSPRLRALDHTCERTEMAQIIPFRRAA
jgi:hypothetical protein